MKVWLVEIQIIEGSWYDPQFETEVFTTKKKAENRIKKLDESRRPYCGYSFSLTETTLDKKNKDW